MANTDLQDIITLDTQSSSAFTTRSLYVRAIVVVASADSPVVVLQDQNGNEVFRFTTAITGERTRHFECGPVVFNGVIPQTLTNITRVFIYLAARF